MKKKIENFRDKENEVDLIIQINKKKENRLLIISNLKNNLSNDQEVIDKLFDLLSNTTNVETGEAVWELIKFLPTNSKVKDTILKLNINSENVKKLFLFNRF